MTLLLFALQIVSGPALAKCASPGPTAFPSAGALPTRPTLHLFIPSHREEAPQFTLDGKPLDVKVVPVSKTPAYDVFEVDIPATTGALQLKWRYGEQEWTIRDGSSSKVPASINITDTEARSSAWTCSWASEWLLTPSASAPVYRVEVAETRLAWSAGDRRSVYVPGDLRQMWGDSAMNAVVQLGHANCFGHTLEWPDEDASLWVGLVGVYPDGSETEVGDPIQLEAPPGGMQ